MPKSSATKLPVGPAPLASVFVDRLADAAKHGGAIADNHTDEGVSHLIAQLRTGAPFAAVIAAAGAGRLDSADPVVEKAIGQMKRASRLRWMSEEDANDDMEPWYLLGVLVGIEIAGGLR